MSEPFLGEIKIVSFNFAPKGWALCNGQLLPINQNQALFSILGTTYGGDGRVNFGLPNLQGSVPFHVGNAFTLGQVGGEINHTLSQSEMPAHTHVVTASSNAADQVDPTNNYWAKGSASAYADAASINNAMAAVAITSVGGSLPHNNMAPYLVLNFCIALQGIFPSRS
jgi:microcystin-dependent protein